MLPLTCTIAVLYAGTKNRSASAALAVRQRYAIARWWKSMPSEYCDTRRSGPCSPGRSSASAASLGTRVALALSSSSLRYEVGRS